MDAFNLTQEPVQPHRSAYAAFLRIIFSLIGGMLAWNGASTLWNNAQQTKSGSVTNAIYDGKLDTCELEFRLKGEFQNQAKPADCDQARVIVSANPNKEVKINFQTVILARVVLANGKTQPVEIKVQPREVLKLNLARGGSFQVIYSADSPSVAYLPVDDRPSQHAQLVLGLGAAIILLANISVVWTLIVGGLQQSPQQVSNASSETSDAGHGSGRFARADHSRDVAPPRDQHGAANRAANRAEGRANFGQRRG